MSQPHNKRVSDEDLIAAYKKTHNIWKTAGIVGLCGQSVWERLKKLNIQLSLRRWSEDELQELKNLYKSPSQPLYLAEFSQKIGRAMSVVCGKANSLGLGTNEHRKKSPEFVAKLRLRQKGKRYPYGFPSGYRELRACPVCGRFFDLQHSSKQVHCSRYCANRRRNPMNTFSHAKRGFREDLGIFVRSSYEANYGRYLNYIIAQSNQIEKWEYEPDTFEFKKIKRGTRFYTPDFKVFFKDNHIEYHEVKGWDYPKGRTARKRMAKYYPQIKLVLVGDDFFRAIRKNAFCRLIPIWECGTCHKCFT